MTLRRAGAVSAIVIALIMLWLWIGPVGDNFASRPPGPANPGYTWYMTYHMSQVVLPGLAFLSGFLAWLLWRSPRGIR